MYSFDNEVDFEEVLFFDVTNKKIYDDNEYLASALLFDVALALGISYYKLCPTTLIRLEVGSLTATQETFWQDFYCL
jgi:hypothetical protein